MTGNGLSEIDPTKSSVHEEWSGRMSVPCGYKVTWLKSTEDQRIMEFEFDEIVPPEWFINRIDCATHHPVTLAACVGLNAVRDAVDPHRWTVTIQYENSSDRE